MSDLLRLTKNLLRQSLINIHTLKILFDEFCANLPQKDKEVYQDSSDYLEYLGWSEQNDLLIEITNIFRKSQKCLLQDVD
jgi:hypothetical protein